jgi:hypothetical protein
MFKDTNKHSFLAGLEIGRRILLQVTGAEGPSPVGVAKPLNRSN